MLSMSRAGHQDGREPADCRSPPAPPPTMAEGAQWLRAPRESDSVRSRRHRKEFNELRAHFGFSPVTVGVDRPEGLSAVGRSRNGAAQVTPQ